MLKKIAGLMFVVLVAAGLTAGAQTPAADIPRIDIQKFTLPNGLEVILSENHKLPLVAVNLWYHVGPVNEGPGQTGFAHLFEHMMFQGSKHLPSDQHFKTLEAAGASEINGTTSFDRTNFFETLPSNQLELALWIESDRMGYLNIDQAELTNQKDVVRNELRETHENRPYGMADDELFHLLFPAPHPYYAAVIGSHEDIQAAGLDSVQKFWHVYYSPNNATLVIAGDIDKVQARRLVEKYFGALPRRAEQTSTLPQTARIISERRAVVQDRIDLPRVIMGWITSPFFTDGDADADIASGILGGGPSSRLYKTLVYEKQLAQSAQAYQYSTKLGSIFGIEVTARPGHTAAELEAAIDEQLEKLRTELPTAAEVERARNVQETRLMTGLQRAGDLADTLNTYNHYMHTPDYLTQDVTRHRNVTAESVRRFAQQQLQTNARVVIHVVPGTRTPAPEVPKTEPPASSAGDPAPKPDEEPWRAAMPKPSAARPTRLAIPQSFRLANGLTVILTSNATVPVATARLVVRTGSDANPIDKPGLANFSASMLDQGTATLSAPQLADELARIGASLSTASTMDASTVTTTSLVRNFPAALNLLADVALHPAFPAAEVERQRSSRLASLVQRRSDNNAVASLTVAAALYGPGHPYGFTELGTTESIRKITREDLQAFWQQHFVPGNAALIIAGSFTLPEARRLAEASFGSWPKGTAAPAALGAPAGTAARLVIVDRPGSTQTQIRVSLVGAARSAPDEIPARVMNEILGGLFTSRINLNLREANGYTYGAFSQFTFRRFAGPFSAGAGVQTDKTAPAAQEIVKEIKKLVDAGVTSQELAMAKDSYARSLPGYFETTESTVASLSSLFVYGLPTSYYLTLPDEIQSVTAQAVQAAAKKYLVPEKLVVIAVGDRGTIAPALEAAFGPAEVRDPDGVVLSR